MYVRSSLFICNDTNPCRRLLGMVLNAMADTKQTLISTEAIINKSNERTYVLCFGRTYVLTIWPIGVSYPSYYGRNLNEKSQSVYRKH